MWIPMCAPSRVMIWKQGAANLFKFRIVRLSHGDGDKKSLQISEALIDIALSGIAGFSGPGRRRGGNSWAY